MKIKVEEFGGRKNELSLCFNRHSEFMGGTLISRAVVVNLQPMCHTAGPALTQKALEVRHH